MAAAGSYDKRNCENPAHDTAVHGPTRVTHPLKKRRSDGWCPNCVKEGNKKIAAIDKECVKALSGRPPRRGATPFGDGDERYTEMRARVVRDLLAAAGGVNPETGQALNRSNLLQLIEGILQDPILLQAVALQDGRDVAGALPPFPSSSSLLLSLRNIRPPCLAACCSRSLPLTLPSPPPS
jgi:hypothetical protein